jgi:metal-sulfur cluster biosynthetic enzyme
MSLFDRVKQWVSGESAAVTPVFSAAGSAGKVVDALREVIDPELQRDIVSLGLVRVVEVSAGKATVVMTLTTAGCPLGDLIRDQVEGAIRAVELEPDVTFEFDPPWTPEQMAP